ncbi:MAG: 3-phosphoshikimate 1-carboxyvinyltransferase [Flavobacteriaceae bacterium]|nr:3-phosphoshikimate 1-carboxyvinyltransferase [Flavobacteriaceae bacterium]
MNLTLDYTDCQKIIGDVTISGSKSESNRLLILQQLYPQIGIDNLSDSDDTRHLKAALLNSTDTVDIGHAGTAMRFLTAYFSTQRGRNIRLTGSQRMQNRPIKILVDALRNLGANIKYTDKEGYPPLLIKGKELFNNAIRIDGNVSSQYLSALLLIAPKLKQGLHLNLIGEVTSRPYLQMTLSLLQRLGIRYSWEDNSINVLPKEEVKPINITVESDWSSASYFYSLVALSKESTIKLSSFKKDSLQGDSVLVSIYKKFGVETVFEIDSIRIIKSTKLKIQNLNLNLVNAPDLTQTIAVTCFGLGIACSLTGLHTLKIKETDRLVALKTELEKLGAEVVITKDSLSLKPAQRINPNIKIATYKDHRMAMAFAPLSLKVPLVIEEADVVSKSYPRFWADLKKVLN